MTLCVRALADCSCDWWLVTSHTSQPSSDSSRISPQPSPLFLSPTYHRCSDSMITVAAWWREIGRGLTVSKFSVLLMWERSGWWWPLGCAGAGNCHPCLHWPCLPHKINNNSQLLSSLPAADDSRTRDSVTGQLGSAPGWQDAAI